jgi:hypothetical protein
MTNALSANVFYVSLFVAAAVMVGVGISGPVFGPLFETPAMQDLLRQVVVPLFIGA